MSRNHDPMRFAGALLAGHSVRPINHKPPFGNGVNVQPSYAAKAYGDLNFGWDLMRKSPKIKTVRIEIEPDMARRARQWIHDACENGFHVIATHHDMNAVGKTDRNPSHRGGAVVVQQLPGPVQRTGRRGKEGHRRGASPST